MFRTIKSQSSSSLSVYFLVFSTTVLVGCQNPLSESGSGGGGKIDDAYNALLEKPSRFKITKHDTQSSQVTLYWESSERADFYEIQYGLKKGNYSQTVKCEDSPCTISGLASGTTYYFNILAMNPTGSTSATEEISIKIDKEPKAEPTAEPTSEPTIQPTIEPTTPPAQPTAFIPPPIPILVQTPTITPVKNTTVPTLSILTPSLAFYMNNGANANLNKSSFQVIGACSENGSNVTLTATGIVGTTNALCAGGGYSTLLDFSSVADGAITITANFTDSAGNTAIAQSISGVKDVLPPAVAFTNPGEGSFVSSANQAVFIVSGTCSENARSVQLLAYGQGGESAGPLTATCTSNSFSKLFNLSSWADGRVTFVGNHQDSAGNLAPQATGTFTKDSAPPIFALTSPANNLIVNNTNQMNIVFGGTCSEDNQNIEIAVTGFATQNILCTDGRFAASLDFTGQTNGSITLTANYSDQAGNSSSTITRTLTKFTANPTLTMDSLAAAFVNGANQGSYPLGGSCSAIGSPVTVTATSSESDSTAAVATCLGLSWSTSLNLSSLGEGTITFTANMSDAGGNPAPTPAPRVALKDSLGPSQPGAINLSATTTNNLSITPEISWDSSSDGSEGSGIASYEIALGTSSGTTGVLPWRSVGISLSTQLTTESVGISFVNNTSYYASVRALDVAGNLSTIRSATIPWTVQLPTPTPTITPIPTPTSTPAPSSNAFFCPTGYLRVPPVPPYTHVDFCVAAYEAKQTYIGTYESGYFAGTSTASGSPWVNISKSNASLSCEANGADYALITNSEWQAVARTIEQDSSNWSGGMLNRGWSNSNNTAVAPSTNDNCIFNTATNTCASTGAFLYKRTHNLAGSTIWDFAGNVSEWVNDNLANNLDGYNFVALVTPSRFTITSTVGNVFGNAKTLFGPAGDYSTLTGGEYGGLGWGFYYVGTNTSIARGGKWNDAYGAGVFTANANTTQSTSVGYRCSYHPLREPTPTPTNIPSPTPTPAYGCPGEYVLVSAIPPYTTSNFCVAVYESKQILDSNSLPLPAASSQAAGSPWPISSRDMAQAACQANGTNYDLISNAEWQTVARTIEADDSNWSGGLVGSGAINRGWMNSNNLSFAPNADESCLYGSASNTCSANGGFLYKRTHHLPFGQIWDFSGNATEIVADLANSTFGWPTSTSLNVSQLTGSTYGLGTVGAITGTLKDVFGADRDYIYLLNFGDYNGGGLGTLVRNGTHILRGGYGIYSTNIVGSGSLSSTGFRCVYHSPVSASEGEGTPTPTPTHTPAPSPTPITCPTGYISASPLIPFTYSPFCVAAYEAKASGSQALSESAGTPWVNINVLNAMSACQANGPGYELITNAEWQTLARTIESIPTNWSGGAVGSGAINRGWSFYYSTGSDGYGNSGPAPTTDSTCLYDGAVSPGNVCAATGSFVYKRTHNLPNGTIWDLSGNVIEMTSDSSTIGFGTETQLSQVSLTSHTTLGTVGNLIDVAKSHFGPAGNYLTLNSGEYGGFGYGTFNTANGYIFRGGYWSGTTNTGIFMVISGRAATATSSDTGFRCVYHPATSRSLSSFQPTPTPTLSSTQTPTPSPTPLTPPLITTTPLPEGEPTLTPTATPAAPTPTPVLICPPGYIQASPLSPFTSSPFCIAVYEARNSSGLAVSQSEGTPWVSLTVADATAACRANGSGYDLITNSEWQSVARAIETLPANWSNGYVGSGTINQGWAYFYSSGSEAVGNTGPAPTTNASCLYNGNSGSNICASTGNFIYKRTHILPSGAIWDLGGNVTEMTSDFSSSGFGSESYISQITMLSHMTFATIGPLLDVAKNLFGPSGDYITLDSGDYGGLGYGYFTSQNSYVARGGYWAGGPKAGIFTVILGRSATSANSDTGFRCVYRP